MTIRDRFDAFRAQFAPSVPVEKPQKPVEPAGVIPAYLVRAAHAASWIAFFVLVYFLWIYTLDIAKDRADALMLTQAGTWAGSLEFWFPHIVGYAGIALGIPYVAKIAIPVFMSLSWRDHMWPKVWALVIAVAVSCVVIAGTFSVQGHAIVEKGRDAVVAEQARDEAIATLQRQKANAQAELEAMTSTAMGSRFQAQAARAGVAGWEATIKQAEAQRDPMLPQIRRAIGSAASADAIRQRIRDLDDKIGAAPTRAAVAERVETRSTGWVRATMDWVDGARAILLSLVLDIVCLLMPWIALRLEQARNRQLAAARGETFVDATGDARKPWADESQMVADMRNEAPVVAEPMDAGYQGDVIFDYPPGSDVGIEKKWVAGYVDKNKRVVPGHYKPTGKRKKKAQDDAPVLGAHDDRVARSGADERSGVEVGDDLRPEATDDVSVVGAAGPAIVDPDAADDVHLRRAAELGDDEPGPAAGVDGNGDADAGDQREDAAVNAASLYAFLSEPNPGRDQPRVVYDAPIGPQQPKGLGPEGKDGVILADVAAE